MREILREEMLREDIVSLPPDVMEMARREGEERRRLYNMMGDLKKEVGVANLLPGDLVVNLGCGAGIDSLPINSAFGGAPFGFRSGVDVLGVDISEIEIERARRGGMGARYVVADGRNLREVLNGKTPKVIVSRHPNIAGNEESWKYVAKEAKRVLAVGGTFITSAMQPIEANMLRRTLVETGFDIVVDRDNRYPGQEVTFKTGGSVQMDKFVLVGVKRE